MNLPNCVKIISDDDYHRINLKDGLIEQLSLLTTTIDEEDIYNYKFFNSIKGVWEEFVEDFKINEEAFRIK